MKLSNEKFLKAIRLFQFSVFLILIITIIFLLVKDSGADAWNYIILLVGAYLLINVFLWMKQYNYISIEEDKSFLIVKFFNSFLLNSGKKKIRIPKKSLVKYEIEKKPLKLNLILYVKTDRGLAKYPPISLSGFSVSKIKALEEYLNGLIQSNK